MGRKIFISYKYKDEKVATLQYSFYELVNGFWQRNYRSTRVRDYVDLLQEKIGADNINLGEKDGESLEEFADSTIETSLKKKIFQSSVTIVVISKGMKDAEKEEKDQWIPWEVSYSLREVNKNGRTSQMNAVLGVVLPDETGSYDWYYNGDSECSCITHYTGQLFKILRDNMFNILEKDLRECKGMKIHNNPEPSFIKTIKWNTFMEGNNHCHYIDKAVEIRDNCNLYDVHINLC